MTKISAGGRVIGAVVLHRPWVTRRLDAHRGAGAVKRRQITSGAVGERPSHDQREGDWLRCVAFEGRQRRQGDTGHNCESL